MTECVIRGPDNQQLEVFSYISDEERVPKGYPLFGIRLTANGSCATAAHFLIDSLRTAVDSATRLQSVIALVHRHKHGRTDPVTLTFSKNRGRLIAGDEWRTSTALGFVSLYHDAVIVDLPQRMTHWMEFIP